MMMIQQQLPPTVVAALFEEDKLWSTEWKESYGEQTLRKRMDTSDGDIQNSFCTVHGFVPLHNVHGSLRN